MSAETLSLAQLQAALDRCMRAHPPEGADKRLHPDADALASAWAQAHLARQEHVDLGGMNAAQRAALERWLKN